MNKLPEAAGTGAHLRRLSRGIRLLLLSLLFSLVLPLRADDSLEFIPLEESREDGLFSDFETGRILELQGKNQQALEYYRRSLPPGAGKRMEILEWYLGEREALSPGTEWTESRRLIFDYLISSSEAALETLREEHPDSLELRSLETQRLFLLPFLLPAGPPALQEEEEEVSTEAVVLIQVGSFKDRENAEYHIKYLEEEKGIEAFIREKRRGDQLYYTSVVEVGEDLQLRIIELKEKGISGFPVFP